MNTITKRIIRVSIRQEVIETARNWPNITPSQARRQACKLIRAKAYMADHAIVACEVGSKFVYKSGADMRALVGKPT